MKLRFLDQIGSKIEIGGEIDKNFTVAQGKTISFAEGATFQGKAIKPGQELYNKDSMSMTIALSIKGNLVLTPSSIFTDKEDELPKTELPKTATTFDPSQLTPLIIPDSTKFIVTYLDDDSLYEDTSISSTATRNIEGEPLYTPWPSIAKHALVRSQTIPPEDWNRIAPPSTSAKEGKPLVSFIKFLLHNRPEHNNIEDTNITTAGALDNDNEDSFVDTICCTGCVIT